MSGLLSPQMDFVFKRIFGNETEPEILVSFLNAVLNPEVKIKTVDIRNTEIDKNFIEDKYSRLDILAITDKGEVVNIEMQCTNKKDMVARSLFYLGRKYVEQLTEGRKYFKLSRTICINVLSFTLFEEEVHYHNIYRFQNLASQNELTDLQELHFIELPKIKEFNEENPLERWLEFIKKPDVVAEKNVKEEPMEKATYLLQKLSGSQKEREFYQRREDSIRDEMAVIDFALEKGLKQGLEQGRELGLEQGRELGLEQGRELGLEQGREQGLEQGRELGLEQGRELGLEQGRELGLEQGRKQGKLESVKDFLDILDDETIALKTGLTLAQVQELRANSQ